jgi:hypothetical protein
VRRGAAVSFAQRAFPSFFYSTVWLEIIRPTTRELDTEPIPSAAVFLSNLSGNLFDQMPRNWPENRHQAQRFISTICLEINLIRCQGTGYRTDTKRSGFSQQSVWKLI